MEGNAEAVGFVADALQHFQGLRIAVDEKRIGVSHANHFFQTLGKAHHRHFLQDAQFGQGLVGEFQLPLTAVDDDELRQVLRIFGQHPGIAAVHHLFHGGVIVGADDGFDLEAAVILLGGLRVAEDHTGSHGVGALDVGIVEAFHVPGQHGHSQGLLQLSHHAHSEGIRIRMLPLF